MWVNFGYFLIWLISQGRFLKGIWIFILKIIKYNIPIIKKQSQEYSEDILRINLHPDCFLKHLSTTQISELNFLILRWINFIVYYLLHGWCLKAFTFHLFGGNYIYIYIYEFIRCEQCGNTVKLDQWLLAWCGTLAEFCPSCKYEKIISKQNDCLSPENQNTDFQKKILVSVISFYGKNWSQNTCFLLRHSYVRSY